MSRFTRMSSRVHDEHADMHYHCDACGSTASTPGKCQNTACELMGEWRTLCRRADCAPKE